MIVRQKVVCIDDSVKPGKEEFVAQVYKQWIKKDQVYTIRHILNNQDIVPGILLKEIHNPEIFIDLIDTYQEPAFRISRFKPLDEFEPLSAEEQLREEIVEVLEEIINTL
jgi:hypothetical protein